jgi:hypothetical protein
MLTAACGNSLIHNIKYQVTVEPRCATGTKIRDCDLQQTLRENSASVVRCFAALLFEEQSGYGTKPGELREVGMAS